MPRRVRIRRELDALQQLHQGEVVQAVARANESLDAAQHEQDRADTRTAPGRGAAATLRERGGHRAPLAHRRRRRRPRAARASYVIVARAHWARCPIRYGAWQQVIAAPGDQSLADALHASWLATDGDLAGLEAACKPHRAGQPAAYHRTPVRASATPAPSTRRRPRGADRRARRSGRAGTR